ncbi:MAG: hypothetical protein GY838_13145 [bacterium]|nr:hypothetical protein [bacterium]
MRKRQRKKNLLGTRRSRRGWELGLARAVKAIHGRRYRGVRVFHHPLEWVEMNLSVEPTT